jgi:hypothetical protein
MLGGADMSSPASRHEIQIANLEAQIATAIAADDWQMVDFLQGLMVPHLIRRMEVARS